MNSDTLPHILPATVRREAVLCPLSGCQHFPRNADLAPSGCCRRLWGLPGDAAGFHHCSYPAPCDSFAHGAEASGRVSSTVPAALWIVWAVSNAASGHFPPVGANRRRTLCRFEMPCKLYQSVDYTALPRYVLQLPSVQSLWYDLLEAVCIKCLCFTRSPPSSLLSRSNFCYRVERRS